MIKLHRFHAVPATTRVDFGDPINMTWRADGRASFELKNDVARRLAVCWNVCEGIPTDALEAGHLRDMALAISKSNIKEARRIIATLDRATDYTNDRLHDCTNPTCQTTYVTQSKKAKKKTMKNDTGKSTIDNDNTESSAKGDKKAFDAQRTSMYVFDPMELCIVGGADLPPGERGPLDTDNDNMTHPLYDERIDLPLTEEFISNIDAYGVLVPISVAKIDGVACVAAGRQRVRAARVVNARRAKRGEKPIKIECKIQRTNENRLIGVMISENEMRQADNQSTKLAKLKRLLDRGISQDDAAITFGISLATVKAWLMFDDDATPAVKLAVDDGKIPHSAGVVLARMKDPEKQKAALREMLTGAEDDKKAGKKKGSKKSGVAAAKKAAKRAKNADSSGGLSNRTTQRKLLELIKKKDHPRAGEKALAWWEGVEDALAFITGEGKADDRLTSMLKEVE